MQEEPKVSYEGQSVSPVKISAEKHADFADRLVRWGIVSNIEQANYVLLGIAVGAILLMLFFSWELIFGTSSQTPPELPIPTHSV